MLRYRVKTKCFHGRLYEVGEEVEFADGAKVPEHFELIEVPRPPPPPSPQPEPEPEPKGRRK